MDACGDVLIPEVVVMKSAQVGWTEIVGNVAGYHVAQDPAPMLVVQPTIEMGETWSKDRLAPMIRDTPALRGAMGEAKARNSGSTLRHKTFPGGHLTIAGANSAASLASRPIRVLLCDEVDRYPASAGTEGDPVTLAKKRTTTFWNKKVLLGSTPTTEEASRIAPAYEASDKRRYWVACPHCAAMQVLRWEQVRWTADDATTAAYYCAECGAAWTDVQRWAAVRRGEWRAEKPFRGVAGFHICELYSPWRKIEETVSDYLIAKDGGIEQLKAWKNTALGETWQEQGDAPEWERLVERQEDFRAGVVPAWAVVLTAGFDNQAAGEGRVEAAVHAWGENYEQAIIHTERIDGDPGGPEVWDRVAAIMNHDWPREGGGAMRIAKGAADTGGQHTAAIYTQLRRLHEPRLMPVKGQGGWNRTTPVTGPTLVDVMAGGRKVRRGLKLWIVAVDVFKAELYRRLKLVLNEDGSRPPGWVHLPDWLTPEEVKQLVAEELVTRRTKLGFAKQEWKQTRANEQLDMAVYARAALSVLGSDRMGTRFWAMMRKGVERMPQTDPAPIAVPAAQPVGNALPALPGAAVAEAPVPTQPKARRSRWAS